MNRLKKSCRFIWEHPVIVLCAAYGITTFFISCSRYSSLCANVFDLGIFDQAIWNISRGRGPLYSLESGNLLKQHFCPVIYILAVPYGLGFGGPVFLLFIQTAAVSFSAWLFARTAQIVLHLTRFHAGLFAVLYLFSTAVQNLNSYDFHPVSFLPALLLGIVLTAHRQRYIPMTACILLAGMIKEHTGLILICLGGALFLQTRYRRTGASLAAAGTGLLLVVILLGNLYGIGQAAAVRYQWTGAEQGVELPIKLLAHPVMILKTVLVDFHGMQYLFRLLIPVAGICLVRPGWLLPALPPLALNLLSDSPLSRSFDFHYQINIMLWVYFAAAAAWPAVARGAGILHRRLPGLVLMVICVLSLADLRMHGRLFPGCHGFNREILSGAAKQAADNARQAVLDHVPPNATLAATGSFPYPEILHRDGYRMLPFDGLHDADYLLVDTKKPFWIEAAARQLMIDIQAMRDAGELETVYADSRVLLLRRAGTAD